ncbi:hypothetical protein WDJ51_08570 [Rathayibacter sp. YIM 133350]|uniref:hypothetical protein n=1 Tax=Rathayibacter sp. YIM 133350 TaxID=3131992 RepID=UPI00307E0FBA
MDEVLLIPIYPQNEASTLLSTAQSTFNRWATGYVTMAGNRKPPFVTLDRQGRGYTVPFVGLAEAWIVRAFKRAGVPMARIRSALEQLRSQIGIEHALASDRLRRMVLRSCGICARAMSLSTTTDLSSFETDKPHSPRSFVSI